MSIQAQSRKLRQIGELQTLAELQAWETQSKADGMFPGEQARIMEQRIELAGRK